MSATFPRGPIRPQKSAPPGIVLTRSSVLALSQRVIPQSDTGAPNRGSGAASGRAVAGGSIAIPGLLAEERLLLALVDGHLPLERLARLSGLSEVATTHHLRSLCQRRVLVPVESNEVTIRGKGTESFFRLGSYEVAARIGQGGMGSVYVCRRTGALGFRRLYALKVIRQGSGQEQVAVRSFVREARVGGLLAHPNLQSLVDVGMYQDQPFLVLQYIEGTSLEELTVGRVVPPEILVTLLIDVLHGLQRAHELCDEEGRWLGLVHGDISPANILIGIDGVARLTDFGSARFTALGETAKPDPMTLGKPAFMAPEQLCLEPLDARSDMFALGVVMWTALTGRDLFAAESYEQIIANVLQQPIPSPSRYGAPECLDAICLQALSRSREGRPGSSGQLARELLNVGVANGLLATPNQVSEYVRGQMAETVAERRRGIEAAFHQMEISSGAVSAAPADAIPVMPLDPSIASSPRPIAQTVVLPVRAQPTATGPQARPRETKSRARSGFKWPQRWDVYLAVAFGAIALVISAALATGRPRPSAPSPSRAAPAAAEVATIGHPDPAPAPAPAAWSPPPSPR